MSACSSVSISNATRLLAAVLATWLAGRSAVASNEPVPLTEKEIAAARRVYVAKCAKCHRFYEPMKYEAAEWTSWMEKMNRKSKLKEKQAALLNRYLDAYRAGLLPGKPEDKPKSPARH